MARKRKSSQGAQTAANEAGDKRKHVHFGPDEKQQQEEDTTHSVLGGMAGGYRLDASEQPSAAGQVDKFSIPFTSNKAIVCQRYLSKHIRSEDNHSVVIFTHGAGGGIANPATVHFAQGFARAKPMLCFQGTMNLQSRVKTFRAVIDDQKVPSVTLGGRSMGARAAVIAAKDYPEAKTLVLVSYPLINAKGTDTRDDILYELDQTKSVLFIAGGDDEMCPLAKLADVRQRMTACTSLVVVKGANHSMSMTPGDAVEAMRNRTGELAAEWLASHDRRQAYTEVAWDSGAGKLQSRPWSFSDASPGQKRSAASQSPKAKGTTKKARAK